MNFVRSTDKSKSPESEVSANIRELVPRDCPAIRPTEADNELVANNLSALVRRASLSSTREVDELISELQTLRNKLEIDGNRLESHVVEYATLSQSVMQLSTIISESIRKLAGGPGIRA